MCQQHPTTGASRSRLARTPACPKASLNASKDTLGLRNTLAASWTGDGRWTHRRHGGPSDCHPIQSARAGQDVHPGGESDWETRERDVPVY